MSLTPSNQQLQDSEDAYVKGWASINAHLRAGGSWSGHERNCVFLGSGDSRFANISAPSGMAFPDDARSLALVDWDGDGDLDVWIKNRSGPRIRFMRNDLSLPKALSVQLRLEGTTSNRDGIGARVTVTTGKGTVLTRTVRAGEGFLGQSSKWLHFGLGDEEVAAVSVRWPTGVVENFGALGRQMRYRLREGTGAAASDSPAERDVHLAPSDFIAPPATDHSRVTLAERPPLPELWHQDAAGQRIPIPCGPAPRGHGKPVLINLWASWCLPCRAELTEWRDRHSELSAAGLEILTLSVENPDDAEAQAKVSAFMAELRAPFPHGWAAPRLQHIIAMFMRVLFHDDRALPVPLSLLVDSDGNLAAIYRGRTDVDTLLADVAQLDRPREERRRGAVPFAGRWHRESPWSPVWIWEVASALSAEGLEPEAEGMRRFCAPLLRKSSLSRDRELGQQLTRFYVDQTMSQVEIYERLGKRKIMQRVIRDHATEHRRDPAMTVGLLEPLEALGEAGMLVEPLRSLHEEAPTDAEVSAALGWLLARQGEGAEGLELLRRARAQDSSSWQVAQRLAWVLAAHPDEKLRDGPAAVDLANALIQADPSAVDAHVLLAAAQAEAGQVEMAAHNLAQAARLAATRGDETKAKELRARAADYEAGKLYRLPPLPR